MGTTTKIEWTDHTFNPWIGCSRVHTGCLNCYAEELMDHRYGKAKWGVGGTRVRTAPDYWRKPLAWNKSAEQDGVRRKVFCASLSDVFEDWKGPILSSGKEPVYLSKEGRASSGEHDRATMNDVRAELFELIDATPELDWLLLTKRPENVRRLMPPYSFHACLSGDCPHQFQRECDADTAKGYRENVWIGTSVSDQATADKAIPELLKCHDLSPCLFLSAEPLVGPVDLSRWLNIRWQCSGCLGYFSGAYQKVCPGCGKSEYWSGSHAFNGRHRPPNNTFPPQTGSGIDWVIAGGESGHGARPCHPDWIRSLRDQCQASHVAFFFKQWGEWQPLENAALQPAGPNGEVHSSHASFIEGSPVVRVGKKEAGADLDDRLWREFPVVVT